MFKALKFLSLPTLLPSHPLPLPPYLSLTLAVYMQTLSTEGKVRGSELLHVLLLHTKNFISLATEASPQSLIPHNVY